MGGSGDGVAIMDVRGRRELGEVVRWQKLSPALSGAAKVGPAGRRLEALFNGGLARSLTQRGQCPSEVDRWRDGRRLT